MRPTIIPYPKRVFWGLHAICHEGASPVDVAWRAQTGQKRGLFWGLERFGKEEPNLHRLPEGHKQVRQCGLPCQRPHTAALWQLQLSCA